MKHNFILSLISMLLIFSSCYKNQDLIRDAGNETSGPSGTDLVAFPASATSTISSNFNGTPIAAGNDIWFNAHLKISGGTVDANTTIEVTGSSVTLAGITQPMPSAIISFGPVAMPPIFDSVNNVWHLTAAVSNKGNIFFSGLIFQSTGLSGGLNPVNFTGTFSTNQPGLSVQWQWSAAVFDTNMYYADLNVVGADASGVQAGQPLGYKGYAIGGARGGGAANLTGSWSATASVTPKL